MSEAVQAGTLFVLSAPSGTGKSTLARALVESVPGLEFSVSHTTRPRRAAERDGIDYSFVSREHFEAMIAASAFLEWANVFGHLYGTSLAATRDVLGSGRDLLLDIDVQGARQVRTGSIASVTIMLLPPDFATLRSRLESRGSESSASLDRRLAQARREAEEYPEFDYVVINDRLEETACDLESIVRAERRRASRCGGQAQCIVASFPE